MLSLPQLLLVEFLDRDAGIRNDAIVSLLIHMTHSSLEALFKLLAFPRFAHFVFRCNFRLNCVTFEALVDRWRTRYESFLRGERASGQRIARLILICRSHS